MTREEAKMIKYRYKYFNYKHVNLDIDEIYDDFKKEKEQLKKKKNIVSIVLKNKLKRVGEKNNV